MEPLLNINTVTTPIKFLGLTFNNINSIIKLMLCPNCKTTILIVRNNYFFCPGCKIYIGQVTTYKPTNATIIDKPIVDKSGLIKHYVYKTVTLLVILFVIVYFTKDLFYIDLAEGCYIVVTPSLHLEFSNAGIKRAIKIIKNTSLGNYQNICERVNLIDTNIACGGFEGGCFEENKPRTIYVTAPARNITWVAEVLAHEACHARQLYERRPRGEQECHQVGLKVMQDATIY